MLREISVGYDPVEDRIELQLRCLEDGADVTHRLQLTRRLALPFRSGLQDLARQTAQVPERVAPAVADALQAGHHQARLQESHIQREPRHARTPEDPPPRLVIRAQCGTRRSDAKLVVRFSCREGAPLTVLLGERTLHALAASLDNRMIKANWIGTEAPALARAPTGHQPPPGLH